VSNRKVQEMMKANVGAFTFDQNSQLMDYRMILTSMTANCRGGKTLWGAWISGEEYAKGLLWQVDPTGQCKAKPITLGSDVRGFHEFFMTDA